MKIVQQPTPPTKRLGDCEPGDVVRLRDFVHVVAEGRDDSWVPMTRLCSGYHDRWEKDTQVTPVDCELRIL